jgi:hypothetical protein
MNGCITAVVQVLFPSTGRSFSCACEQRKKMQCRVSKGMLLAWSALIPTHTPFLNLPLFSSVAKIICSHSYVEKIPKAHSLIQQRSWFFKPLLQMLD